MTKCETCDKESCRNMERKGNCGKTDELTHLCHGHATVQVTMGEWTQRCPICHGSKDKHDDWLCRIYEYRNRPKPLGFWMTVLAALTALSIRPIVVYLVEVVLK